MISDDLYRPCVALMVLNQEKKVFLAQRCDEKSNPMPGRVMPASWQLPQGGIDHQETEEMAALRELREETGMKSVKIIAQSKDWYYYDLPELLQKKVWNGAYKGQKQRWFLMSFLGLESEICLTTQHPPEFSAWKWAAPDDIITHVVDFKKDVYQQALREFSPLIERLT